MADHGAAGVDAMSPAQQIFYMRILGVWYTGWEMLQFCTRWQAVVCAPTASPYAIPASSMQLNSMRHDYWF
jgi:hypothetical protein